VDQHVRFRDGIAYACVGSGPPLVMPPLWVGHLEREWEMPEYRAFIGSLAETHTVVRHDRLGTGMSDRNAQDIPAVRQLETVIDALELDEFSLLGVSWGAATALAYAATHRGRTSKLALFGAFAHGEEIAPRPLREALVATVRAHWGAGSRALADVWLPGARPELRDRFARLQRASADAETAARTLETIYATDIREHLKAVTAPALLIHRRGDKAIPYELGRSLAATLANARLVTLEGEMHLPWLGAGAPVLAALHDHLDDTPTPEIPVESPLSAREQEVLRLVSAGLADAEIAAKLVVSPHTVHRHVANIRTKLGQPSRAAAVAYAARRNMI
jgi:pimeloyl-ACP methyl ester carboxylesterase/DNA-binding CsgD family transcriptional regulator